MRSTVKNEQNIDNYFHQKKRAGVFRDNDYFLKIYIFKFIKQVI